MMIGLSNWCHHSQSTKATNSPSRTATPTIQMQQHKSSHSTYQGEANFPNMHSLNQWLGGKSSELVIKKFRSQDCQGTTFILFHVQVDKSTHLTDNVNLNHKYQLPQWLMLQMQTIHHFMDHYLDAGWKQDHVSIWTSNTHLHDKENKCMQELVIHCTDLFE